MIGQNRVNNGLSGSLNSFFTTKEEDQNQGERFSRIKSFLLSKDFNGFTSDDLFIMQFINKGWGQDIAALSNMAEALVNLSVQNPNDRQYESLINEVVKRATHLKVNPYKKDIMLSKTKAHKKLKYRHPASLYILPIDHKKTNGNSTAYHQGGGQ